MLINPKTCWQYCIHTDHLREPPESWELLQYMLLNPTKSLKQCAEDKNIDYGKAMVWSSKYYYQHRKQAYTRDMNEAINTAVTNYKIKQVQAAEKRADTENSIMDNQLYFLKKEVNQKVQYEKNGDPIPEYLEKKVEIKEKNYWNNRLNKIRGDKAIDEIANATVTAEDIEDNLINDNPAVNMFLKAMKENRE